MKSYVYKRNKDGIHYLDLAKTWEKLMVAARIIAAAQAKNPKDVLVSDILLFCLFPNERFSHD
jgi:small subunit ribosomal protein SAe